MEPAFFSISLKLSAAGKIKAKQWMADDLSINKMGTSIFSISLKLSADGKIKQSSEYSGLAAHR